MSTAVSSRRVGTLTRLRYRWSFRSFLADLLSKTWMEPAIPFALLLAVAGYFALTIQGYASLTSLQSMMRLYAEGGFVAVAMALAVISGGIDLSVGSVFAVGNFTALVLFKILGLPMPLVIGGTLLAGAVLGAFNGVLIGYLKARPFLITMVTLIILRAGVDLAGQTYSTAFATSEQDSPVWSFIGEGSVFGLPSNIACLIVVLAVGHVFLSRSRYGWRISAVGSSRKAARHAGIGVEWVLFTTYVLSGTLCAAGGLFYAARQESAGSDTGVGWEIQALTAVVLGGISLSGGKGTVWRATIGAIITFLLVNGFVRIGAMGSVAQTVLGLLLLIAVGVDVKWAKNRGKAVQKIYVNPTLVEYPAAPAILPGCGTPYEENDRLAGAEIIGLDLVEGPEDILLDRHDRLYTGTREGWIHRFSGPNFEHHEIFARIGGRPLGLAMDRDENLLVCVGGMGLYGVRPDGETYKLTDETTRTWTRLVDDSRLRLADDLDIAPDGKIYFSEATVRYEMHSWDVDGVEGRRNGRLICYDPATRRTRTVIRDVVFPNGVCLAHDGQSVIFASTWLCKLYRYWIAGPRVGTCEVFVDNLPGNPDNINRASDGCYWVAMVGIRAPTYDLAMRHPEFRRRMVKEIPRDEWLYPGLNNGCIVKIDDQGRPIESLWDPGGRSHPTLTSMREHKGYLYLGGLDNNRIGRVKLPGADPTWTGWDSYWGRRSGDEGLR